MSAADPLYRQAAVALRDADALLIGAGAGMGVDSGLPDFRGNEGFWKAYPALRGRSFVAMANPVWFERDPPQAWGFYGHRLQFYRQTTPHPGFAILKKWAARIAAGAFVFTSNVDGHFQKAGFAEKQVLECHGSIHHLQCTRPCTEYVRSAEVVKLAIDNETLRATSPLPQCPFCGAVARPNVLMFDDTAWVSRRSDGQWDRYHHWLYALRGKRIVAVELGAGTAIPTVRLECERRASTLIRINPREPETDGGISLPVGALEGLSQIDRYMNAAPARE